MSTDAVVPKALTITEALAELKTNEARRAKKTEAILRFIARDSRLKDIEGGSPEFVRRERQAITDLEERHVSIRTAIQSKNLNTQLMVGEVTRSLQGWLNWRREISEGQKRLLASFVNGIASVKMHAQKNNQPVAGPKVDDPKTGEAPGLCIINIDEKELVEEQEALEKILGDLDGKLSLLNATTTIEI